MCDDVWFERFLKEDLVMPVVNVSLENLRHDVREISEKLSPIFAFL